MRICVLHPSYEHSSSLLKDKDPPCNPARFLPEHEWHDAYLHKATAVQQLGALRHQDFDVFVNLCDGAWDEDRAGIEVVQTLERLGLPFTGATSNFYEPSREMMKRVCHFWGIKAPAYVFAAESQSVELA